MKKCFIAICIFLYASYIHSDTNTINSLKLPIELSIRLAPEFGHDFANAIKNSGDAINNNLGPFFTTLGNSLPRVGPGVESVGESFGRASVPVRNQILKGILIGTIITCVGFLFRYIAKKFIKKYWFKPELIEKQSSYGLVARIRSWFRKPKPVNIKDHMIISEALASDLNYIMKMTANIKKNGGYYDNILFYGAPGTGKTLFAQLLAEHCGMDYAIIPAANISQFLAKNEAVEKLNELFDWASKSSRGTLLFFDEAETFLADRSSLKIEAQNALNAFLAKTGMPSNRIMIICATNRPQILDGAVLSRFGNRVEFLLPDVQARKDQLVLHINNIFGKQKGTRVSYECLQDPDYLEEIAQRLDGYSGRTIQQFVNRLRQQALAQDVLGINHALVDSVLKDIEKSKKLDNDRIEFISGI